MNQAGCILRRCALAGVTLTAAVALVLLAGCRGNTTAAATIDHHVGKPPTLIAQRSALDLTDVDPLMDAWQAASWQTFVAPANSTRMPPPTRGTVLYDAGKLYVAVICESPAGSLENRDAVSLYLDTTGQGHELLQITTDSSGTTQCTWIRSSTAVEPQEDGSPNLAHPLDLRPDFKVNGLSAHAARGFADGRSVWTLTLALPLTSLPPMMQVAPAPQNAWKFNLLRTLTTGDAGQREQLQSNLSPVYVNAQAFSPYRLATLQFAGN